VMMSMGDSVARGIGVLGALSLFACFGCIGALAMRGACASLAGAASVTEGGGNLPCPKPIIP